MAHRETQEKCLRPEDGWSDAPRTRKVAAAPTLPPIQAYLRIDKGCQPSVHGDGRHPGERDPVVESSVCRAHALALARTAFLTTSPAASPSSRSRLDRRRLAMLHRSDCGEFLLGSRA